jgi:YfiH family protein
MFYSEEKSGIKYFQSSLLKDENLVHAFSTRIGGNTPAPMNSFSLGTAGMIEFQNQIDTNRKNLCDALKIDFNKIINPEQKHTDNIKMVKDVSDDVSNTDGIITDKKELVLLLLFADCTPIILYAPDESVLGVIHAGWRGTAKQIVPKAVKLFEQEFNISPKKIKAAVGAAIGQCCYPVSQETYIELKNSVCSKNHDNIFKQIDNSDKVKVDLKRLNYYQLIESGVINVDISDVCTSCNNSLYYSYRADNGLTGRHGAIASLR